MKPLLVLLVILWSNSAKAGILYWDTSNEVGLQAGNGDWSTIITDPKSQRWTNNLAGNSTPAAWTQNSDAVFQTNGTSAVNVSGVGTNAITVNSITFDGTGYTISGDPLTLTGTGGLITTNASAIINATLQGTVGLTKLGNATLTLGTSNAYSGATQVNGGTLLVVGNTPTTSVVTVSGVGTLLGGTGTVGGTVSVGPGAIINAGLSPTTPGTALAVGSLTTGALTLSGALHTDASGTAAAAWDRITAPGTFTITSTATFDVSIASGLNFTPGTTYTLVDATILSGTFTGFGQGSLYSTNGYNFTVDYDTAGGNFNLIAVPEPSTWAAGALTLAAVAFAQRLRLKRIFSVRPAAVA